MQNVRLIGIAVRSNEFIDSGPGVHYEHGVKRCNVGRPRFHKRIKPFKTREYVEQIAQIVLRVVIIPARYGLRIVWRLNYQHIVFDCEFCSDGVERYASNLNNGLHWF